MLRFPVPGAPLTPTDNERTLMKPLIRILEKAGIRWGIGCADWLPIDPQHCAAEIGLNLRHVKLSEIGDTAELEAFFDEFANPEAPCLFLSDIDVSVLAAWDDEEEREAMRGIIVRGLARIAATHGHHFIVTGLTSLTKDICREAFENAEPLAPHETEELFTISHEQVGLLYGADGSIGTWINLLPEFYCKLWTLAQAGRCTELNRLQTAYTEFLRKGWQFGILNAFQELMRSLGYAEKCFRAPAVWQPGSMPEPLLQELLADLDGLNALAASMS